MKKYFVSFADKRLSRSLSRITYQAEQLAFFDKCLSFDEDCLSAEFLSVFKDKLITGSRGFGYWCWKPEVIKRILDQIDEGDAVIYVDAGCHINKAGKWRLREYFELLEESPVGILAFQAKPPTPEMSPLIYDGRKLFDQPNYRYIKGDLLDYFGVRDDGQFTNAQAIGAGIILLRKSKKSLEIVDEWCEIIKNDFTLLDDTPSKSTNLNGFIAHRHDQAIFTLLCLKHRVPTLSAYEYWYPKKNSSQELEPDWDVLVRFPIHAKRDKDMGLIRNATNKLSEVLKKLSLSQGWS